MISIEDFLKNNRDRYIDTLITAYSYEDRIIESLDRSVRSFNIKRAIVMKYNAEDYLDSSTLRKWEINKEKMCNLLKSAGIKIVEISCRDDDVTEPSKNLETIVKTYGEKILIDLTGFTKNYILKLAQIFDSESTLFLYTRSEGHRLPTPEEQLLSINKIIPIDGFEGFVNTDKKDLIVLILGYEGNRALSFLKKFETEPIFTLIGNPHLEDESANKKYIESAKKANARLLNIHRVALYEIPTHSYNPFLFAENLENALRQFPSIERYNICISCLGTKMQTLGTYLLWKKNPNFQILYSIPYKRLDIGSGAGTSWIIRGGVYK
jgi:hypothetical protein